MTRTEKRLMNLMGRKANSFEAARRNFADAPLAVNPAATMLAAAQGNPGFAAQFDVQFLLKYFTVVTATGVATAQTPAQLIAANPSLGTQLPGFLFGNSDFAAGYVRMQQAFQLSGGWIYADPGIWGKDLFRVNGIFFDATIQAQLRKGDMVQPVYFVNGANTIIGLAIVRCQQVGYGVLLDALSSDRFIINMVRYVVPTNGAADMAQYNNQIGVFEQSLFGKFNSDYISPTSFKMPEQMQDTIIDVPLEKGIDKQVIVGTWQNYDAPVMQWSIFVSVVDKIGFR